MNHIITWLERQLPPLSQLVAALLALAALVGSASYFLSPVEPSVPIVGFLSIFVFVLAHFCRRHHLWLLILFFMTSTLGFMAWTAYQIQKDEVVFLPEQAADQRLWVVGKISEMGTFDNRTRITVTRPKIYGVPAFSGDVRISAAASRLAAFDVGSWVALEAKLFPPHAPEFAGDFNGERAAWLAGIGASGYVFGEIHATSWPEDYTGERYWFYQLRSLVTERILSAATTPATGGVMAALISGNRNFIPDHIYDAYRETGLAHLLAISGLHVGLVAGFLFLIMRRVVGFHTLTVQRFNTKKIAAIFGIMTAGCYTLLAGATLPTLRAFIMATLVFGAMLLGRLKISLHYLYVTVVVVLAIWPESVVSPSFQMSFTAVFFLLVWVTLQYRERDHYSGDVWRYMKGVMVTSVVASLATLPIVAWHFGMVSLSGVVMNIVAMPLTAFWILPAGVLGLFLMPLGLDAYAFLIMDIGVMLLNRWTLWGQSLPSSGLIVYQQDWLLVSLAAAVLLLLFLYGKWRAFAASAATFVLVLAAWPALQSRSDRLVSIDNGGTALLVTAEQVIHLIGNRRETARYTGRHYGDRFPVVVLRDVPGLRCSYEGCLLSSDFGDILVSQSGDYSLESCYLADVVVSDALVDQNCPGYLNRGTRAQEWLIDGQINVYEPRRLRIWH